MILEIGEGIYIAVYRYKLAEGFDKSLNETIINYRPSDSPNSRALDFIQSTLHCCGNHDYMDWINSNHVVPKSCCKNDSCDTFNLEEIYTQGCYNKVMDFVISHSGIMAYVAVGFALFSLVGVFLTCCLARTIKKANYEPME
ncbi:tetraspanin-6-like [Agrilus planipennis]|uniref:Tetraspanin-6-like n=1 Tax=Agrilus planipennis TaxID=224129 RepID=A0A1W4XEM2_AGRPL|nr:tetraspanin-6-like [Agrilus planipennis]